jgi:hypothetical protein
VHLLEHLEDVDLVGLDTLLGLLLALAVLAGAGLACGEALLSLGLLPRRAFSAFSVAVSSSAGFFTAGFFSALGAIGAVLQLLGVAGRWGLREEKDVSIRSQRGVVRRRGVLSVYRPGEAGADWCKGRNHGSMTWRGARRWCRREWMSCDGFARGFLTWSGCG